MPELPEVETMRRGIRGIVGSRIEDALRLPCRQKPIRIAPRIDYLRRRVRGRRIDDVVRAGKRVVVWIDTGEAIVFEPRMTGLVLIADPPDPAYLRMQLRLQGGPMADLFYWDRRGLGSVRLLTAPEFDSELGSEKLGPDALVITAELFHRRLGASKRPIKVALLDQRAVAGIGNIYASEILHVARIHPARPCNRMTTRQWQALADATRAVLNEAIRCEGSTLGDGTYRNALNQSGGYQNLHRVYDRTAATCPTCSQSRIERIVQAQRCTFFCPACQRRAPVRRRIP